MLCQIPIRERLNCSWYRFDVKNLEISNLECIKLLTNTHNGANGKAIENIDINPYWSASCMYSSSILKSPRRSSSFRSFSFCLDNALSESAPLDLKRFTIHLKRKLWIICHNSMRLPTAAPIVNVAIRFDRSSWRSCLMKVMYHRVL